MNDRPIITSVPLRQRQTPLSDMQKLERVMESVVERSNNKVLGEMRALNRNLERALSRAIGMMEGVAKGEKDLAVASVVEGDQDDLPRLARVKADPALVYTKKTAAIAKELGISTMRLSFLLNKSGLDWVGRKPDLWSSKMRDVSGTRLWHPKTAQLLKKVLDDPKDPERKQATAACRRFFAEYDGGR